MTRYPMTKTGRSKKWNYWSDEEIESAILLHKILPDKRERLAHLNTRFGNERTLSSIKMHMSQWRQVSNQSYHLHLKWSNYPACYDSALTALSRLLKRSLVHEGESLWYREELIALASLSSGPSSVGAMIMRLKKEYGVVRDVEAQLSRMQQPSSPSRWIWVDFHNDKIGSRIPFPLDEIPKRSNSDLRCVRSTHSNSQLTHSAD